LTSFVRYWLPPLAWMAVIWGFSTDMGSADHTGGIVAWIVTTLWPWATPADVELAHGLVRKLGHLGEYAILAALWFRALRAERRRPSIACALAALGISVAWAITDEVHQIFVPSRTPAALDVLIDSMGALGAVVMLHARTTLARLLPG
jgi:VanZ family protein